MFLAISRLANIAHTPTRGRATRNTLYPGNLTSKDSAGHDSPTNSAKKNEICLLKVLPALSGFAMKPALLQLHTGCFTWQKPRHFADSRGATHCPTCPCTVLQAFWTSCGVASRRKKATQTVVATEAASTVAGALVSTALSRPLTTSAEQWPWPRVSTSVT